MRRYEPTRWPEENLFLEFLDVIGIPMDGRQLHDQFRLPCRDPNPTLGVESLHLLDTLDSLGIDPDRRRTVVRLLLGDLRDDKSTFVSDELARRVDEEFEASNRAIAREWFGERSLFSAPSSFVCRPPDRAKMARYFNQVLRWLPLLEMPVWGGARCDPRALQGGGKLRVDAGWTAVSKALRLAGPTAALVFRVHRGARVDLRVELEASWQSSHGRLALEVNGRVLYEGERASCVLVVPGCLHDRRGGGGRNPVRRRGRPLGPTADLRAAGAGLDGDGCGEGRPVGADWGRGGR